MDDTFGRMKVGPTRTTVVWDGLPYIVTGIISGLRWLRGASNCVLPTLSGAMIVTGVLNAYVEAWEVLKRTRPRHHRRLRARAWRRCKILGLEGRACA